MSEEFDVTEMKALAVLVPGVVFRVYNKPNPNYAVCHVRAIVDHNQIVYRVWSKRHWCWLYRVQNAFYFGMLINCKDLTIVKKEAL
jgi:hypothetical protein